MEGIIRKPFQGVLNIIRFNWHFYVMAILVILLSLLISFYLPVQWQQLIIPGLALASMTIAISLAVSYYVYDRSGLYELKWLDQLRVNARDSLVNIHAGFDETSVLIVKKFPDAKLSVMDFYDPDKHTEVSIERARKAYPAYPGTEKINTLKIPLKENSVDMIFLILAAHEIRDEKERIEFFNQLRRALKENGRLVVMEHLRDPWNFLAYTIGFLHFFSLATWKRTFEKANLSTSAEQKVTPFISLFILQKNGASS